MLKSIKFDFAMFFPLHLSGTMENRTEVIKEYFELRLLLNRANQKSNQKTELDFEIRKQSQLNNINLEQSKKILVDHVRIRLRSLGFG